MKRRGHRAKLPVICVGNLVAGGAGKTPTAILIALRLKAEGYRPVFLTRGYGGSEKGPLLVDAAAHNASLIGDEAPLLARAAPTIVSHDRIAGAALAASIGNVIVMDDGLQNSSLQKDFSIAVIDSVQGIGNGRVIPAGPLRAPLEDQLNQVDVCLSVGDEVKHDIGFADLFKKPIYRSHLVPDATQIDRLRNLRMFAFAGIGRPEKFFETLKSVGAILVITESFPDHYVYTQNDLQRLVKTADDMKLTLITTAKDAQRIATVAPEVASQILVLHVALECQNIEDLMASITLAIRRQNSAGS